MEKIDKAEVIKLLYELDLSNKEHQYAVNFINSLPTDYGYTTRNYEVVKMLNEEVKRLEAGMDGKSQSETISAQDKILALLNFKLTLLTKLKDDKK